MTEERVCKLEDRAIEMIQSEEQREKKIEKNSPQTQQPMDQSHKVLTSV